MTTSFLSAAVPVDEIVDIYIKICIYGQNRVGKTTLACGRLTKEGVYIPGSGFPRPILLLGFEPVKTGGARSVKLMPGVSYIKVTSSRQGYGIAAELAKSNRSSWRIGATGLFEKIKDAQGRDSFTGIPYECVVIDTATSYQDIFLQEILGKPVPEQTDWGTISQDQYRERSSKCKEGLRPYMDLNMHTVILAQEKDHNPPKEERNALLRGLQVHSFFASDLGGATVKWLHDACDSIVQLHIVKEMREETKSIPGAGGKQITHTSMVETGRLERRLRTLYHPNFAAGIRSEHPDAVPEYIVEPSYQKIFDMLSSRRVQGGHYLTKE